VPTIVGVRPWQGVAELALVEHASAKLATIKSKKSCLFIWNRSILKLKEKSIVGNAIAIIFLDQIWYSVTTPALFSCKFKLFNGGNLSR
jgi:hypothetical protein